jgi:hypothetical protein
MSKLKNQVYIKPTGSGTPTLKTLTEEYLISQVQYSGDTTIESLIHPVFPGDDVTAAGIFQIVKDLIYNDNLLNDKKDAANEAFSEGVFDLSRSTLTAAMEAELQLLIADRDAGDGITWLHTDNNDAPYTEAEQAVAAIRLAFLLLRKYSCAFNVTATAITPYAGFYGKFDLPDTPSVPAHYTGKPFVYIDGFVDAQVGTPITIAADNTNINTTGARGNTIFYGNSALTLAQQIAAQLPKVYLVYQTYIGTPAGCSTQITLVKKTAGNGSSILTFDGIKTINEVIGNDYTLTGNGTQIPTAGTITVTGDDNQKLHATAEIDILNGTDVVINTSTSVIITAKNSGSLYNKTITGDGVKTIAQLVNNTLSAKYHGQPDGFNAKVIIVENVAGGAELTLTGDGVKTLAQLLAEVSGRTFTVTGSDTQVLSNLSTITIKVDSLESNNLYVFDSNSNSSQILKINSTMSITGGGIRDVIYNDYPDLVAKIEVGPGKIKIYEEDETSDSVFFVRNEGTGSMDTPIENPADGVFYVPKIAFDGYYRRDLISVVFRDTTGIGGKTTPYLKYEYGTPSANVSPRHNIAANKILTDTYGSYPLWSILYKRSSDRTWILKTDQIFAWSGLRSIITFSNTNPYKRENGSLAVHTHEDIPLFNLNGETLNVEYGESAQAKYDNVNGDANELTQEHAVLTSIPVDLDAIYEDDSTSFTFPYIVDELYNDYITYDSIELRSLSILVEQLSAYTGREGIEANVFTMPKYANSANNSELEIGSISIVNNKHRIVITDVLNDYKYTTTNNTTYISGISPVQNDVILIISGKGKGQIATINSISVGASTTEIFLTNTFLNPIPVVGAKFIILKSSEEAKVGYALTDTFLDSLNEEEQADYAAQYYPKDVTLPDRHSGTSRLPYSSKASFRSTINLYGGTTGYVEIEAKNSGANYNLSVAGNGIDTVETLFGTTNYNYIVGGNLIPANGEIISIAGGALWNDNQLVNQLEYAEAHPTTHKMYGGTAALITFPFKLRININQYYFIKIVAARKLGIGASYGTTIKTAIANSSNPALVDRLPWFSSIYHKNAGSYPGVADDGTVFFGIYHKYYQTGYYELKDIENQEVGVVQQRVATETAVGSTIFLPPYWKPIAKNLDSVLPEEQITPPARPLNTDPLTLLTRKYDINAPGIVYVDVQSGKIMFHPDDEPTQLDIFLTFTKDNVITGQADTESILHITDPESSTSKIVTLRSVLENLQVQIDDSSISSGPNSMLGNATASRTTIQELYMGLNEFLVRASVGNIQAKPFTDYALTLVDDTNPAEARTTLHAVSIDTDETIDGIKTFTHIPVLPASSPTTDNEATRKKYVDDLDAQNVKITGDQTIAGIKTLSSIPVLPALSPTTDNEATRKKYVDDLDVQNVKITGDQTIAGIKTFSSYPILPATDPVGENEAVSKQYTDHYDRFVVQYRKEAPIYYDGLANSQMGLLIKDTDLLAAGTLKFTSIDGLTLWPADLEQKYPVSRLCDSRITGTDDYNIPIEVSELEEDKIRFTFYWNLSESLTHSRVAFQLKLKGTDYTSLIIKLHTNNDTELGSVEVPYADLVEGSWFYVNLLSNQMEANEWYHYHIYINGTYSIRPILYASGTDKLFKTYYKPTAGEYLNENVIVFYNSNGNLLVPERAIDADVAQADELFVYDIMGVDFSDATVWQNWSYNNYIGVDLNTGRVKFPDTIAAETVRVSFNAKWLNIERTTKAIGLSGNPTYSLDDWFHKHIPFDPADNPYGSLLITDQVDGTTTLKINSRIIGNTWLTGELSINNGGHIDMLGGDLNITTGNINLTTGNIILNTEHLGTQNVSALTDFNSLPVGYYNLTSVIGTTSNMPVNADADWLVLTTSYNGKKIQVARLYNDAAAVYQRTYDGSIWSDWSFTYAVWQNI